jgi:hypothetical protein
MSRFGSIGTQYFNNSGKPLSGGGLYFFESGGSIPKTVYSDADQTVPHPVPVPLDAAGRQPPVFFNGAAKAQLADVDGALIEIRDPVGAATTRDAFADWNALLTYNAEDIVRGSDNKYYQAITNSNIGLSPLTSGADWQQLVFTAVWNAAYTYEGGALVVGSNDALYRCTVETSLDDDPVDVAATDWTQIGVSGWSALIEDLTPALGGNLDVNGKNVGAATPADLTKLNGVTASAAELNKLDGVTASPAELNRIVGVTSALQTQLNAKAPAAGPTFTGTVTLPGTWTITVSGGDLLLNVGGVPKIKFTAAGAVQAVGNVGALETL